MITAPWHNLKLYCNEDKMHYFRTVCISQQNANKYIFDKTLTLSQIPYHHLDQVLKPD